MRSNRPRISAARCGLLLCILLVTISQLLAQSPPGSQARSESFTGDELVAEYFRQQTEQIAGDTFSGIDSLEDWLRHRPRYRRELLEMLGLDPMPERTPLKPVITGTVEHGDIVVEKLYFQSMPGLYVTANLYRPKASEGAMPAILYVCGHGGEWKDGISLGNKTHYQHHGAWFARNGYVCLTIDTIQLGEIEGIHHGTYREKMWWWNNRGYTPAGVEAWNSIRSLDYLQTRPEVDPERIGMTGRSGGGAYTWWTAAIDDRVKVAVPVAGITSLHNHVVDGTVEGHCDCMFMVNTYRWDFPKVAALVAPRPLLISNTDKDRIFPLDGVIDVHGKVRRIYQLHDADDHLGLHITEGPHRDTQELRIHAFRWFNRFLKQDDQLIETAAKPLFEKHQLKVLDAIPSDERVSTIHESFVPAVSVVEVPTIESERNALFRLWMNQLREHCFRGWPTESEDLNVEIQETRFTSDTLDGEQVLRTVHFTSQRPYRLKAYWLRSTNSGTRPVSIRILDQNAWEAFASTLAVALPSEFPGVQPDSQSWAKVCTELQHQHIIWVAPRGVGPTEWTREPKKRTQIRRRFMLVGQTAATMQIYDVRRALQALQVSSDSSWADREIIANGEAAVWALYAALFEPGIDRIKLSDLPGRNRDGPDILNISRFVEIRNLLSIAESRVKTIETTFASGPN